MAMIMSLGEKIVKQNEIGILFHKYSINNVHIRIHVLN